LRNDSFQDFLNFLFGDWCYSTHQP